MVFPLFNSQAVRVRCRLPSLSTGYGPSMYVKIVYIMFQLNKLIFHTFSERLFFQSPRATSSLLNYSSTGSSLNSTASFDEHQHTPFFFKQIDPWVPPNYAKSDKCFAREQADGNKHRSHDQQHVSRRDQPQVDRRRSCSVVQQHLRSELDFVCSNINYAISIQITKTIHRRLSQCFSG